MSNIRSLLEKIDQFAGQAVGQKPGDQVRGTERATKKKSGEHPFKGRLVGASESASSLLKELQQELDKPEATVRRDLFREFAEFKQGVTEEDAWHDGVGAIHSQQDSAQDAWHGGTSDAWHGETSESQNNPADTVSMDIPLLIRIMEYAKEDAQTDMDLHRVAERLTAMSAEGNTLGMDQYDAIVGGQLDEYGGVGAYGAAPQTPTGTGATQTPDAKQQLSQQNAAQMQKSLGAMKSNLPGAINTAQALDPLTRVADNPATDLDAQALTKLEPITKALPNVLADKNTAGQLNQLITKAQNTAKTKQAAAQQQQQQPGTNPPGPTKTPTTATTNPTTPPAGTVK